MISPTCLPFDPDPYATPNVAADVSARTPSSAISLPCHTRDPMYTSPPFAVRSSLRPHRRSCLVRAREVFMSRLRRLQQHLMSPQRGAEEPFDGPFIIRDRSTSIAV